MLTSRKHSRRIRSIPSVLSGAFRSVWGRGVPTGPSKQELYMQASNLLKSKKYPKALVLFSQLIESFPESTRARRGRALCKMGLGDNAGAMVDIEYWIANQRSFAQQDADAFFHLGECLRSLGRADEAKAAMRKAIAINPLHTRALQAVDRSPSS